MRPLYEKCDLKNKLLLTVGGGGVAFATVQSKWEVINKNYYNCLRYITFWYFIRIWSYQWSITK